MTTFVRQLGRALSAGAIVMAASPAAWAAPVPALYVEAGESELRCLVAPPRKDLAYPAGMAALKVGGLVRVGLVFAQADAAPQASVLFDGVGGEFRRAVLDYVASYRLPCLQAGAAEVVATQEFQFLPGDGREVIWSAARDSGATRNKVPACVTGGEQGPDYPRIGFDGMTSATVLVRYTFADSVSAPAVEVLYEPGPARFTDTVRAYAAKLRLPCLGSSDVPLRATQLFRFVLEGARTRVLKDATLPQFAAALRNLDKNRVRFDFTTMGCPFDVRLTLLRPVADNAVGEVAKSDPNRREFLEWLRQAELDLSGKAFEQVIGDTMTISVPCLVLDLL